MAEFAPPPVLSIRRTLLRYLGALSLAGAMLLFLGARSYGRAAADRSYDHLLVSSALSIAGSVALIDGQWQVDLPYAALDLLAMAPEDRVFYRVANGEGATITGYDDLPEPPTKPLDGKPTLFDADYRGERTRFVAVLRWVAGSANQRQAVVQVGQTRIARNELADDVVLRAIVAIAVMSAAMMALVWFGVHRVMRPLQRIEHDLSQREPSDLRAIEGPVPLELAQMVAALNRFMGRLSASNETLRAFMAEAAHQMRTPLAALRAQAQLALDEDAPGQQHSLVAIERNASQLTRLLNQLLSDASAIHRANVPQFDTVDLAEVLHQAVDDSLSPAAPRPDVRLACTSEKTLVRGDALLLREAIKNLIDNAIKHGASERGPMQVALTVGAGQCVLAVADYGPGIRPAEAHAVFERFVRGQAAATGGAGLGLAIVKRIVESHGGRIDLSNRSEGGLVVSLRFPRVTA
jgi:two-component system sensor histidine kinase TctE